MRTKDHFFKSSLSFLLLIAPVALSQPATLGVSRILNNHSDAVNCLAFAPNGEYLFSGASDGFVGVWPLTAHNQLIRFERVTTTVAAVACSPDGKLVLGAGREQNLQFWLFDGTLHKSDLLDNDYLAYCLAFDASGKYFVSGGWDGCVRLWEVQSRKIQTVIRGHLGKVRSVCFDPSGKFIASGGSDNKVGIWSVPRGDSVAILDGHEGDVNGVCYGRDGKTLISCSSDGTIRFWSATNGFPLRVITANQGELRCLSIAPSGKILASGGKDGSVALWSLETGERLASSVRHANGVNAVCFSNDGSVLASGGTDKQIILWKVE